MTDDDDDDDEQVGHTTSGCYSPLLGSALAMASVPPMFAVPGTELKVKCQTFKK